MSRPVIAPVSVNATAPETFEVLDQRMRVVEDQASTLLKDLEALGANGCRVEFFPCKPLERSEDCRPVSPLCARGAFGGENNTLWKCCEQLVSRMCRLESVVQTLRLSLFRLQTEKDLNPQHAANLEQRLNTIQKEHLQELKTLQAEGWSLRQQLSDSREEAEKACERAERLSAALEIATATKRDVAVAAKELRATKNKMNHNLQEVKQQLSKESSMRKSLEESQEVLLYRVQDMEQTVENERKQVHILQLDCNSLHEDIQAAQERLREEEERAVRLEQECAQLRADLESRENTISKLSEEEKAARLSSNREHEENLKLRSEITALQEMAGEVQVLNEQLSQQCEELSDTLRSVTMENAKLISDHQAALKAEQDKINRKLQEQDLLLDAARANITGELQNLQKEKAELQRERDALLAEHADCKQKACEDAETTATQKELLEAMVARLQSELETELKEKERREEEMQRTVREITQENTKLEAELTGNKLEIDPLKDRLASLEEENKKLTEREASLEHQLHAQQQVEQALANLTEDKNKLVYDNGKLQSRMKQLEEELQPLAEAHSENSRLRKLNTALETEYNQVNAELGSLKRSLQKTQAHLKQTRSALECREEDFFLAAQSRDEALRENEEIKQLMSTNEERGKRKLTLLRRKLEEAKGDNLKVTTLLENVLTSHKKMEKSLEKTQAELARKDSELASLRKDRTQSQQQIQKLEAELEQCHSQLSLESQHSIKTDPLRKALEVMKGDNKRLAQNLEQTLESNSLLQSQLARLQEELESKDAEYQQLVECRDQLIEEAKVEAQLCAQRLETLKKQFQVEREAIKKAAQKESAELKKALDEVYSKSADVSRCNRELRAKVVELDEALVSHKERVKRQKVLITQYFNSKTNNARNTDRIKEIEQELRQMEEMKEQYQKKNQEQSVSIKQFINELACLQTEMQQLARNQEEVAMQNRHLEGRLEVEHQQRQQLEEQCKTLEETVTCLKKCKEDTEKKLKEASVESEQITANLEEAHHWFKSKFDSLQRELAKNRQQRMPGEQVYEEEERLVKLPSQACLKRWETKQHLKLIARKYLS